MRMGLEFPEKLDLLGSGAADDVACNTCAANASVVTHPATEPIAPNDLTPSPSPVRREGHSPRDLKPWLSSAIRSDGKRIALVKTLVVQSLHRIGAGL